MIAATNSNRPQSWMRTACLATFRIIFIVVLFAGLGMALGLFGGILFQLLLSLSGQVDMTLAYRHGAIPTALIFSIAALAVATVLEVRAVRRNPR